MKLYIADDNVEFANYCAKVARLEGWQVQIFQNGSELLAVLRNTTEPALILCDMKMPEMDGIDVIKELSDPGKMLRIRFVTGGPMVEALSAQMIGKARDLDIGRFLLKPISLADLKAVLLTEAQSLRQMARASH